MRLIDADALTDELLERICKECDKRKGIKRGKWRVIYNIGDAPCRACWVDDIKDELENAPTADAEPSKLREVIEPYRDFCKWVAEWIFKEDFEESAGAFAELACRKLAELGYVFKDGEYWLTVDFKELEE